MSTTNVLSLILGQHKSLKESLFVLTSDTKGDIDKQKHLVKFINLLKMHTRAEEATIYEVLMEISPDKRLVLAAEEEHHLANSIVRELESMNYQSDWTAEIEAKAKVLGEIVKLHIDQEEKSFFEVCRQTLTRLELEAIGEEFQLRCMEFDDKEHEITMSERIDRINHDLGLVP